MRSLRSDAADALPRFPPDLAETVGAVRLMQLALEAVAAEEIQAREFRGADGTPACSYRMLATLMSYAYARGLLSSEDIENQVRTDADLRYLCARELPDAQALRQFRRREWACLNRVLVRLLASAAAQGASNPPRDPEGEAAGRMERAAAADSLALDY
ncbi:MAG: transposase [Verrucomicrobiae bacterium]|nr:transposase [Verrucomicrobiae bacterium]